MSANDDTTIPNSYKERGDEIERLREQLAAATATAPPAVEPDTTKQPVAASPSATDAPLAVVAEAPAADHTLAPGSAGVEVSKLAHLLESLGEQTYLRVGENPSHVFDDALMASVRRVLSQHAQQTADPAELPQILRDVASMDIVDASAWAALRELVAHDEVVVEG